MKICGWRRSISYRAVVPVLAWPAMKKSGTRPGGRGVGGTSRSVKSVIAPQAHQVAVEVLAERDHLVLVAAAQLTHQLLIGRLWLAEDEIALHGVERPAAWPG